jgi:peptide/nickel transport system substrate-binding protein
VFRLYNIEKEDSVNMIKRQLISLLLVLVMILGLTACGGQSSGTSAAPAAPGGSSSISKASGGESKAAPAAPTATTPAGKEDLIFALDQEPASLDPYMHSKQQGFTVGTLIYETLIKKNSSGEFIPWLATEWEQKDDTTFIFKLRNDVTFHDGGKFTAEDAAYSLILGSQSSFSANLFGSIDPEGTKALDDYTLELKLKAPYAPLFEALASFRGAMLSKNARETVGQDAFGRAPVGTGPMKFKEWVSGDRIELEAYDGYWGEELPFKKAVARIIVEGSARAIDLETGGIDIAMELAFSDWERIEHNPETVLIAGESQSHSFILLNNSMEPTNNEKVRKALAHALDMENLVKTAYQGQATVADSFYAPSILGYKPVGPYEYNVEKAKALLAEAGYPNGLKMQYFTMENQINMTVAEVVKNMWGQIGVEVDIQIVDLATQTQLNNDGKCPAASMAPTVAISDPDAGLMIWPIYRTISIRHNDQHIQDLLDKGRATYAEADRIAIYQELQEYLQEKCYSIPLAFPRAAFGTRAYITGLEFAPSLVPDLTQVKFA